MKRSVGRIETRGEIENIETTLRRNFVLFGQEFHDDVLRRANIQSLLQRIGKECNFEDIFIHRISMQCLLSLSLWGRMKQDVNKSLRYDEQGDDSSGKKGRFLSP